MTNYPDLLKEVFTVSAKDDFPYKIHASISLTEISIECTFYDTVKIVWKLDGDDAISYNTYLEGCKACHKILFTFDGKCFSSSKGKWVPISLNKLAFMYKIEQVKPVISHYNEPPRSKLRGFTLHRKLHGFQ